jgi:predicted TIM-barrel fold metal-dependent hydrolase
VEPSITDRYPPYPVTADQLIASMDKANIRRGLVLSTGFYLGGEGRIKRLKEAKDNATAQQLEDDWHASQVARYPGRLFLACGVNPLDDHAMAEMVRCKKIPQNRAVKLNVGEGGDNINLNNSEHVAKLRRFFKAANDNQMPITILPPDSIGMKCAATCRSPTMNSGR